MLSWISANLGTIIVSLILIAIVTAIIVKMIRDRKNGNTSCGCNCEHCAMHGRCHK